MVLSIMLVFTACEPDDSDGDYAMRSFNGIVMRDNLGNYEGIMDEDDGDWTFLDDFNLLERELFTEYSFPKSAMSNRTKSQTITAYDEIVAYPNPTTGLLTLNIVLPEEAEGTFKMLLIDADYNILWAQSQPVATGIFSNLISMTDIDGIEYDNLYRLLYCTMDNYNNFKHMGHGDVILINY